MYELPKTNKSIFRDAKGFERSKELLKELGDPQNTHPAIHVAGTSGKGSVCYLIDAILRSHGKKTGLMVSPHVYDIRERIQLNGKLVSKARFLEATNTILERLEQFSPSYFEFLTCLGFLLTSQEKLDYLVVETGFGGLWDTTNTITRSDKVCVINQIGYDHTAILGETLPKIAFQKAGIIQNDCLAILLKQETEVNTVFNDRGHQMQAQLHYVERRPNYQDTNQSLAQTTTKIIARRDGWEYDHTKASEAAKTVFIPGRFEQRKVDERLVIFDGAHNPQKIATLVGHLKRERLAPATFILAMGERKDWKACLKELQPIAARIIATEFFTQASDAPHRPLLAADLAQECRQIEIETVVETDPKKALRQALAYPDPIVVTGSFYLLGEVAPR